jgi:hypothetical protein
MVLDVPLLHADINLITDLERHLPQYPTTSKPITKKIKYSALLRSANGSSKITTSHYIVQTFRIPRYHYCSQRVALFASLGNVGTE